MKKAKQQAKKRVRITEFPDIEPGAWTSSPSTSAHLVSNEQSAHKRPRTEDHSTTKDVDHPQTDDAIASNLAKARAPVEGSPSELLADKDVLARVPKPQVSAFSEYVLDNSEIRVIPGSFRFYE